MDGMRKLELFSTIILTYICYTAFTWLIEYNEKNIPIFVFPKKPAFFLENQKAQDHSKIKALLKTNQIMMIHLTWKIPLMKNPKIKDR